MAGSGINISGFGVAESKGLFGITKDMVSSWINKPQGQSTLEWLGGELGKQIGLGEDAAQEMSHSLMGGIDSFNQNLAEIDAACAAGGTKEEWMEKRLVDAKGDMQAQGKSLAAVHGALAAGNEAVQAAIHADEGTIELLPEEQEMEVESQDWNKFSLKKVARDVTQQAILAGVGGAALPTGVQLAAEYVGDVADFAESGLDPTKEASGSEVDCGFKAAAAGALKIAADKGIIPFLTKKTPLSVITTTACWGVESVRTAGQVFRGQISVAKAVERMGRVSSAAIGDLVTKVAPRFLSTVPVIGLVVGTAVATVVSSQCSKKVRDVVYAGFKVIQPVATKVAERVYETAKKAVETVKSVAKGIVNFFLG